MRPALFVAIGVLVVAAVAFSAEPNTEVLLKADAGTLLPVNITWRGRLVQNGGPNSIFCGVGKNSDGGTGAVTGASLEIATNSTLYMPGDPVMTCIAKTADQVTGAATRVTAVP